MPHPSLAITLRLNLQPILLMGVIATIVLWPAGPSIHASPVARLVVRTRTTAVSPSIAGRARSTGPTGQPTPKLRPVGIAESPGEKPFCTVGPGAPLRVVRKNGPYSLVQPLSGSPPIKGWIQTSSLGLRVLRNAPLFPNPGGRPIGRVRGGILVRTVRRSGRFILVEMSAKAHALVWMQTKDLGIERARATSSLRYVGGARRILKPGPVLASPAGSKVAVVVYPAEVRVLGKKRLRGTIWAHVNLGTPWHIALRVWVPWKRLNHGFGIPSFGTWYAPNPPHIPSHAGSHVLAADIPAFASSDDAYASIHLPSGTAIDVKRSQDPEWITIQVQGRGIHCSLQIPQDQGIWIQERASRRKNNRPR